MRVYASTSEFKSSPFHEGSDTTTADLIRASLKIDEVLAFSAVRYETDDDGYPVDSAVRILLRDAACAQIAYYRDTGDISGAGEYAGVKGTRLAPEAVAILRNAGLVSSQVGHG